MQYNKGMLTAIAAMPYDDHTVMFVGTEHGQLLKVRSRINKALVDLVSCLTKWFICKLDQTAQ